MTRNPCWYQILSFFFFSSEDFKNGNKIQKSFKEFSKDFFFYTMEKKRNLGWIQLNTLPLQFWSYKWRLRIKKGLFLFHTGAFGCLQTTWISVGAVFCYFCFYYFFVFVLFFLFRCSHVKTGGVCKCASAIRTWVELVWGGGTPRSSDWTVESWILTLDRARSDGGARRIKNKRTGSWRRTGVQGRQNPGGTGGGRGPWRALDPALTDSPMHFVHSSCEVHSGDGSTTYNRRRIATTFCLDEEVTEKEILIKKKERERYSQTEKKRLEERGVFSTSCT